MAIQNATGVVLSLAGTAIAHCTSASLSISRDLRDSTTKSSGGWSESLGGLMSWEMSGDAFVDITEGDAIDSIASLITGAAIECTFVLDDADSSTPAPVTYTGDAFITSISMDAGVEENSTWSISLTGTADLGVS